MRAVLFCLAAINLFGQGGFLSPKSKFDLNAGLKHNVGPKARSFFGATRNGLTLVTIGDQTSIVSADLDGRILHTSSGITSVNAQIYRALPLPDGRVWSVSQGPYEQFSGSCCVDMAPMGRGVGRGSTTAVPYNQFDLYSPDGKHSSSLRLMATGTVPTDFPIAAASDMLVMLAWLGYGTPQTALIRFGTVIGGHFHEERVVEFDPPFRRTVAVLAGKDDLVLIDKVAGNMVVVDPQTGSHRLLLPARRYPVRAAAADIDSLYLLSSNDVLKTDLTGTILATYRFRFDRGFRPATLGVAGNNLYLVDHSGRVEEFQIR